MIGMHGLLLSVSHKCKDTFSSKDSVIFSFCCLDNMKFCEKESNERL